MYLKCFYPSVCLLLTLILLTPLTIQAQSAAANDNQKPQERDDGLPLKATQKIEFDTDEGTWMSLDVSPDGKLIVFDLLGDIYTLSIEGGRATRIIGGLSFESQPKFSPDGKRIVFLSDRTGAENIWTVNIDGSEAKALTTTRGQNFRSPSWTPDGQYVICSRGSKFYGPFSLWLFHKDGGTGVELSASDSTTAKEIKYGAVMSTGGRYIYYSMHDGLLGLPNFMFPQWQVVRFDREAGETETVTDAPGSALRPVLSPDGRSLVYATRYRTGTALRVRNLETGEERWLINGVTRDDQESPFATRDTMPGYAFDPDGKSLIVPIDGKIQRVDFETGKSTVIPFTAKVEAEVAPRVYFENRVGDGATFQARLIRWPTISPDGKRMVFSSLNHLWMMDLPSGKPRRLTNKSDGEFMPSWSPDGKHICYVTWSSDSKGQIYRVNIDGGANPERLTRQSAFYSYPVYSPDSSKIIFLSSSGYDRLHIRFQSVFSEAASEAANKEPSSMNVAGPDLDLRFIPASGGSPTRIGSVPRLSKSPQFSRALDRVYVTTPDGLMSIRLDGYDRRVVLKVTGPNGSSRYHEEEIRLSPDGQRAFVSLLTGNYLVSMPAVGKETVTVNITGGDSTVPVKKLSGEFGNYLSWSPDGNSVIWAVGRDVYIKDTAADKTQVIRPSIEASRYHPVGTLVLSGARIVTMKGDEIIESGDIVVTDNRITAVGAKGKVTLPKDAKVIDVSGETITPGFIDLHAHMQPPRGVNETQVWQYLANLAYGVTTVRDPQSGTNDIFAYSDLVETGEILGPRLYSTGPGVFVQGAPDTKEGMFDYIKRYKDAYQTNLLKEYQTGDRKVRQWVAMACREFGLTATTEGGGDAKLQLSQMADGFSGNEHNLPMQPLYNDVVQYVVKTSTFYTPTLLVNYGAPLAEEYYFQNTNVQSDRKLRRFIPDEVLDPMVTRRNAWLSVEQYAFKGFAKGAADIVRAGGRVGVGGHGELQGLGTHWEIWSLQSGGMTRLEALRCATLFGAEALGLQRDLGSIEVGKLADLVVLDKDPTKEIRNTTSIKYVMKNGELFVGDTLDQIWPVEKKLGKMYWWNANPPSRSN